MIRLSAEPFDPSAELSSFTHGRTASGAIASFIGLARGEAGSPVLELEAYRAFAEAEIGRFVDAACQRFVLHQALVIHRLGVVAGGEPIVLVATAAAHRREAFQACDYLMDYLKSRAPFWKREFGPAGPRWVEPTGADLADLARWE